MNKIFGFLFLLVGLAALAFAFMMGGSDGNGFRMETLLRLGGGWPLLGGAVCLFLSYLTFRKKAPAVAP